MPLIADPIVTLSDTKAFLNITSSTSDTELNTFIAAASQAIVNRIGPVSGSPTVSEWHDGGLDRIVLRHQGPIQSVTSVTESYGTVTYTLTAVVLDSGSTATAYGYSVDLDRGVIVRRASGIAVPFASGVQNVHVTYVAGYSTVPSDISHATLLLIKSMWETQRAAAKAGSSPNPPVDLPARVEFLLAPYIVPGIA